MCSCSTSASGCGRTAAAWLKWSSNEAGAARTLTTLRPAAAPRRSRRAPASGGERARRRRGSSAGTARRPRARRVWCMPSRSMSLTGACGRLIGSWREVRATEPGELGVEVGEQPRLQQRVVGDVDAGHEVPEVEGHLLGLGEVVGRVARSRVSRPTGCTGASSSGTSLVGSSRSMPSNVWSAVSGNTWMPSSHCGKAPASIASARSRRWKSGSTPAMICASSQTSECTPSCRLPVELHQRGRRPSAFDQPEGVDAEALHRPVGARDARGRTCSTSCGGWPRCAARRSPRRCRGRSGPAGSRGPGAAWPAWMMSGNLIAVLDEEHRHVVADEVEGALVGVELRREPAGVADGVGRAARAQHRREPHEDRRLDALGQERRPG